jgi:EAL domain-containing protein (putative c-di-GMP-specific phosphodiesterase class I)
MAKERNIAVCARGVDNAKMFEQVRKFDVDLVEGIFNGRPLHSAEFVEKLLPKERVRRY